MSAAATPISPELALVCPELRRQWAAALPDIDPDALFRTNRRARPKDPSAPAEPPVPFLLAAATYALSSLAASLLQGVVTLTVVAVVALVLTLAG